MFNEQEHTWHHGPQTRSRVTFLISPLLYGGSYYRRTGGGKSGAAAIRRPNDFQVLIEKTPDRW